MSFLSDLAPDAASRVLTVIAVGALTTAGAGVGTAAFLTGSADPAAWTAAYQLARECRQPSAAADPKCSAAAAQALAEQNLAARLEREAQQLETPRPTPAQEPTPSGQPDAAPPQGAGAPSQAAPRVDDAHEAGDD